MLVNCNHEGGFTVLKHCLRISVCIIYLGHVSKIWNDGLYILMLKKIRIRVFFSAVVVNKIW